MGFFGEIFSGHKLPRERKGPTDVEAILNRLSFALPAHITAEQAPVQAVSTIEKPTTPDTTASQSVEDEADKAVDSLPTAHDGRADDQTNLQPTPRKRNTHQRVGLSSLTAKVPIYISK